MKNLFIVPRWGHFVHNLLAGAVLLAGFTGKISAQTIPNPSFEANTFSSGVGYASQNGGVITGWTISNTNNIGLNLGGSNNPTLFANNGVRPNGTNVAFIQSAGNASNALATTITGLTVGNAYSVTFRANMRAGFATPVASWSLNGGPFAAFTASPAVNPAGTYTSPYYTNSAVFTATAATAALVIANQTATDSTLLIDHFTIVLKSAPVLGTTNLLVGPAAGTSSVVLGMDSTWTATANDSWLQIAPGSASGTNSGTVVFTYDENGGFTRTGTLTIAGRTVTITQAGYNYVAANPVTALVNSGLSSPHGVAVDGAGNVYVADRNNNAIKKWTASNNTLTTLVSSNATTPLDRPYGVAVDGAGNVYIADLGNNAIKKWTAANNTVTTLVSSNAVTPLNGPVSVAVDGAGNVFIADYGNNAIKKWTAANSNVTTLVSAGLNAPTGVAVDVAGNVYIADSSNNAIKKWTAANGLVTSVGSGFLTPFGVAVDGAGNVFIADYGNNAILKWTAANGLVSTLVSSLNHPRGVAVDSAGSVYFADTGNNAIKEIPWAFVNPDPFSFSPSVAFALSAQSGGFSPPLVLPTTVNLNPPFAPTSTQPWLTVNNLGGGELNCGYTRNTNTAIRATTFSVLGVGTSIFQSAPTYTLATSSMDVSASASTNSVALTVSPSFGYWTATNNGSTWLSMPTPANGVGSTNIGFTVAANPSPGARTNTLTIAGMTFTVRQAGLTFTIIAAQAANGFISPAGTNTVSYGSNAVYSITPSNGFYLATLTVDGSLVSPALSYSFNNVTSNRTITATFAALGPVTTTNDAGAGSLREIIAFAGSGSTITFAPGLSGATILLTTGELLLNKNLTIDATALPNGITISGNNASRVFNVASGTTNVLTALTISSGNADFGGGINNNGTLTVNQCTLSGNASLQNGGGIYNSGTLTVNQSTLSGNVSFQNGGGIYNNSGLLVNQSTLSGNTAALVAGGIFSSGLTILSSIVCSNTASTNPDMNAQYFTPPPSGFSVGLMGVNAMLAPLGNYGGPTPTMPPLPGSPAINRSGTMFTTDQRGFPRIIGPFADIGAVEGIYNPDGPGTLRNIINLGNGAVQFGFTNYSGMPFSVLASTNVALPLGQWSNLGQAVETPPGSGQFQFTDPQATNNAQRFYRVRVP